MPDKWKFAKMREEKRNVISEAPKIDKEKADKKEEQTEEKKKEEVEKEKSVAEQHAKEAKQQEKEHKHTTSVKEPTYHRMALKK